MAARALPGAPARQRVMLAYALIPLAGAGLFVGLTEPDRHARARRRHASRRAAAARTVLLVAAAAWSVWLAHRQIRVRVVGGRRAVALAAFGSAVAGVLAAWVPFVFRILSGGVSGTAREGMRGSSIADAYRRHWPG